MSIKTITKFTWFVIPLIFSAACSSISYSGPEHARIEPENGGFEKAEVIATVASKEINESSGLAVSKCQPDVFWTHNDSGDGPFIYAFDSKGGPLGKFRLGTLRNVDWEDMSSVKTPGGECQLYLGEFGDNDLKRDVHEIYRFREPRTAPAGDTETAVENVEVLKFRYPAERHNAETLIVEPATLTIYVVTKQFDGPAHVYVLDPRFDSGDIQTAQKAAELSLPASPNGFVTGGDISADGMRVVLCDYYAGYELQLPQSAAEFNEIWQQKPTAFDLGPRAVGESIAYANDGNAIFATTERVNTPLIRVKRK